MRTYSNLIHKLSPGSGRTAMQHMYHKKQAQLAELIKKNRDHASFTSNENPAISGSAESEVSRDRRKIGILEDALKSPSFTQSGKELMRKQIAEAREKISYLTAQSSTPPQSMQFV